MIELNSYVIKPPLNFDMNYFWHEKALLYIKHNNLSLMILIKSLLHYHCFWHKKKHINATLDAQIVFTKDDELQRISVYKLDDQI